MVTTVTQKRCLNCEELIHPYATSCPYCGYALVAEKEKEEFMQQEEIPPAPYRLQEEVIDEGTAQESPFRFVDSEKEYFEKKEPITEKQPSEISKKDPLEILKPMVCLLSGMVFFLFGLALMLYTQNGVLTLKWNGNWWPFYLLLSLPLLFFGWQNLQNLDEID